MPKQNRVDKLERLFYPEIKNTCPGGGEMERNTKLRKKFDQLTEENKKLVIAFVAQLGEQQCNLERDPCSPPSKNHTQG